MPKRLATTAQEVEEQEVDTEANAFFTTSARGGRGRGGAREQGPQGLLAHPPRRRGGTRQREGSAATTSRGGATPGILAWATSVRQRSGQAMFGGYGVFDPAAW